CIHHHAERGERGKQRHGGHQPLWHPRAEDSVQHKPRKGQQRNQPDIEGSVHSFIRSIRSTARVARARKTAMMMARPTAASAAATIITKRTKIWPFTACHWWAKVTKERLTALSMISMDMKTVMRLRY